MADLLCVFLVISLCGAEGESNCYADDKSARVGYRQIKDGHMTHELCTAHCEDLGAAWALPQYGHECFCADSDTDLDQYGPATCDYECEGNSDQICGGRNAFTVIPLGTNILQLRCQVIQTQCVVAVSASSMWSNNIVFVIFGDVASAKLSCVLLLPWTRRS